MTVAPDTIPQQIRRRRDASRRMQTLPDGRRDPIDSPRNPRPLEVTIGTHTAWFEARPIVRAAVRSVRPRKWQYDARVKAIAVPLDASDDLLAWLEHRGVRIDLVTAVVAKR